MTRFNLNIEHYVQSEQREQGLQLRAIAAFEYPVIHFIARTIEHEDDSFIRLDHFILKLFAKLNTLHIDDLIAITGMSQALVDERVRILIQENNLERKGLEVLSITEQGKKQASLKISEREFPRTRSFLLDGITHEPLNKYFYLSGKEYLISEKQKNKKTGKRLIAPSVIYTPPNIATKEKVLRVPIEMRAEYHIPQGLIDITAFDIQFMTFPFGISIFEAAGLHEVRKLVNCCEFYADIFDIEASWKNQLKSRMQNFSIRINELAMDAERKDLIDKRFFFANSWRTSENQVKADLCNFKLPELCKVLEKEFDISEFPESAVILNQNSFAVYVTKQLIKQTKFKKEKLLNACLRKRDYIRQHPWTGVWLVLFDVEVVDPEAVELVKLYGMIKDSEESGIDALETIRMEYSGAGPIIRQMLLAIGQNEILERYDIEHYMKRRMT